jgi:flagellum-specific peptidoglycan hydrolase FlgJ
MRRVVFAFLLGCAIAASVFLALGHLVGLDDADAQAVGILDDVIAAWATDRLPIDTIATVAQFRVPQRSQFRVGFIPDTIFALAQRVEELYRVPKGVTISQWVLESHFGLSDLGANNTFGHTYAALRPFVDSLQWVVLREKTIINGSIVAGQAVRFAKYMSLDQCFDAHGRYLSGSARYRSAFETTSPQDFARMIARSGYATDPDYALKLITIMRRYRL